MGEADTVRRWVLARLGPQPTFELTVANAVNRLTKTTKGENSLKNVHNEI